MDIGEYFGCGGATGSACARSSGASHSTSMDSTVDLSLDSLVILDGSTGKFALDAISVIKSVRVFSFVKRMVKLVRATVEASRRWKVGESPIMFAESANTVGEIPTIFADPAI